MNTDLCEKCSVVIFHDDADHFSEGTNWNDEPTLRHAQEGSKIVILEPARAWRDTLPDLPSLDASAKSGCGMCEFLREKLLERKIECVGDVAIGGGYLWGGQGDAFDVSDTDPGLAFWRCEVYKIEAGARKERVAALNFDIETSDNNLLQWLRVDSRCAAEPLDPDNVEWLKTELWDCEDECGHTRPASLFVPTRLVDVGQSDKDIPRLVVAKDMPDSQRAETVGYAALSYCWGPREEALKQIKTTQSTLSAHCAGMPLSTLSPVVLDTVLVCRALQIRYLWVDALCIIQGDKQDWDRESQIMGEVYYSCSVTICPVSSRSCLQGYLNPRPRGLDLHFQSSRHEHIRGTYRFVLSSTDLDEERMSRQRPGPSIAVDLRRSAWDTRGWTFQELVLAPRMIIFGSSMSHFACETKSISENGHVSQVSVHGPLRSLMNKALGESPSEIDRSDATRREAYWQWTTVNEVQNRTWTFREDIFPGLSGLAQACALVTGDVYLAGLWKDDLHYQLVWEAGRPLVGDVESLARSLLHPDPYVAPSWSWASRTRHHEELPDRQFSMLTVTEETLSAQRDSDKVFFSCATLPCHLRPEFTLVDYHMDTLGSNPFGPLSGAFLRIRGRLCPFPCSVERRALGPSGDCRPSYGKFAGGVGTCMLDWGVAETSVQEPRRLRLLLISSCCSATVEWRKMKWLADCDDLDFEDWMPSDEELGGRTFDDGYEDIETCKFCRDPRHKRTGWGLVVYPAEDPGSYVRVGVFVTFAHKGGMEFFNHQTEEIVLL
ncbi:hypothetical protein CPLU01_04578 [Colletotrichum plurivorum]|uniref:Heterokaryon incompatibility domain-containing protein n=1 Tax=Colletotrichum plurivorum TaxID=2175906 RepID=A0A8H6NJP2_9PEZI|nr:hypothetical protein CPLU01_04578 [Colletotrichum plurivorum]